MFKDLWLNSLNVVKNTERKARINSVVSQIKSFGFFYVVSLAELILHPSDNLSQTLQKENISAAAG